MPSFDTLRQAVIDPERAYVGAEPPAPAAASQIIDRSAIENAPWAQTPLVHLNPGLVTVIGARGSGKTALADMIAAGCDSHQHSQSPSFLARAAEHLRGASVAVLEGEIARLEIVAIDADTARRLTAVTKRIADETAGRLDRRQHAADAGDTIEGQSRAPSMGPASHLRAPLVPWP